MITITYQLYVVVLVNNVFNKNRCTKSMLDFHWYLINYDTFIFKGVKGFPGLPGAQGYPVSCQWLYLSNKTLYIYTMN